MIESLMDLAPISPQDVFLNLLRKPMATDEQTWKDLPPFSLSVDACERFRRLLIEGNWRIISLLDYTPGTSQPFLKRIRKLQIPDLPKGIECSSPSFEVGQYRSTWAISCELEGRFIVVSTGFLALCRFHSKGLLRIGFARRERSSRQPLSPWTFWRRPVSPR